MPDGWTVVDESAWKPVAEEPKKTFGQQVVSALTNAAGPIPKGDEMPFEHAVGPETKALMNTPIAHPTGVDRIDQFTSPANLAFMALNFAKPAAGAAIKGLSTLADTISPDAVGIVSPKLANAMRMAQKMRTAVAQAPPTPEAPVQAQPIHQALADAVAEAKPPAQAPAPAAPAEIPAPQQFEQPPAQPAAQQTAAPVQRFGPGEAQASLVQAAEQLGYRLSPSEVKVNWPRVMQRGPEEAISVVQKLKGASSPLAAPEQPPVGPDPAQAKSPQQLLNEEAIARRRADFQARKAQQADAEPSSFSQLPTTPEMEARVRKRNDTGQWNTPTADMKARLEAGVKLYEPPPTPKLIERLQTEMNTQSPKLKLNAEEYKAGLDMMRLGLTPEQVRVSIEAQRKLMGR